MMIKTINKNTIPLNWTLYPNIMENEGFVKKDFFKEGGKKYSYTYMKKVGCLVKIVREDEVYLIPTIDKFYYYIESDFTPDSEMFDRTDLDLQLLKFSEKFDKTCKQIQDRYIVSEDLSSTFPEIKIYKWI